MLLPDVRSTLARLAITNIGIVEPRSVAYQHFTARGHKWLMLPNTAGGLPMIADRLWARIEGTFRNGFDRESLWSGGFPSSAPGNISTDRPPSAADAQLPV